MKYRTLGNTNWQVSEIGFGAWALGGMWGQVNDTTGKEALEAALNKGVNFIDTAHGYGNGHSEELIGDVISQVKEISSEHPLKIATKIPPVTSHWPPHPNDVCEISYPRNYIRSGVEASLRRLKVEAIDVMQLHTWTRAWNDDPVCLQYLEELKKEGKILAYGVSTPENDQNSLVALMEKELIDTAQVIYNLFDQDAAAEFLSIAQKHNIGVIVRCSLDEGSLTGKFTHNTTFPEDDFRSKFFKGNRLIETLRRVDLIKQTVESFPSEDPLNLASVAVRFVLQHPAVSTVITGIRTPEQVEKNTSIVNDPPLDPDLYELLKEHNWRRYFWELSDVY